MASEQLKLHLHFNPSSPPVAALFCLSLPREKKVANVETLSDSTISLPRVEFTLGVKTDCIESDDLTLTRSICSSLPNCRALVEPDLVAPDLVTFKTDLDYHVDLCPQLESSNKMKVFSEIDNRLRFRTFLVGHQLSLGDIALYSAIGKAVGFSNPVESCDLAPFVNLKRWMSLIHSLNSCHHKIMKVIFSAYPGAKQHTQIKPERKAEDKKNLFEGKLPGAVKGQVVTRFPPEPSGYLHIGHAKAALLNAYYAKAYDGKLIVRFDDTNPLKEKMEFERSIIEDLKLLDISADKVSHTSDYFDEIQKFCEQLIRKGIFYVDDTPQEQMRFERGEGIEGRCRSNTIDENIRRWGEMMKGSVEGLRNCVRAKIDIQSKNKCMRDPVMYRCVIDVLHHIHGDKYKVYPTYDFACPIVDSLEGVTHAMRTNEYADRIPQYQWVINSCQIRPVIIYEFSRLNLVNTVLSKRRLQWLVDHGIVESWEDPRFPTVRGIRRRGLTAQALMEFILEQGPSKNVNLMEWDKLWTKNKQVIDPIVPRYMAVDAQAVPVILTNGPVVPETKERELHPKNTDLGKGIQIYGREILIEREDAEMLEDNEELTLMRWCNAIVESIVRTSNGSISSVTMRLNPEGDFKLTKKKIHWVSKTEPLTPVSVVLREFDHIITKKKPEEDDKIEEICNTNSIQDTEALADPAVSSMKEGDMLQFERRGYFRLDQLATPSTPAVFIKIPDGKSKSMSVVQPKVSADKLAKGQ